MPRSQSKVEQLRYQQNDTLCDELFAETDALKLELDKHRSLTQGELQRLYEDLLIEYIYNSTIMDGNTLTLKETTSVLKDMLIDKLLLNDYLEVVGHKEAFYVQDLVVPLIQSF